MEVNEEFKHKMKRRSVEIMKKAKRLAELAGEETVSLDFLQSILELQLTHQEATAVALRMLPTKKVADAYTKAQVSCLDFIETVTVERTLRGDTTSCLYIAEKQQTSPAASHTRVMRILPSLTTTS